MDVKQYREFIKDKKVAVIGVGVSNLPLIDFLFSAGAKITAYDKRDKTALGEIYSDLFDKGVEFVLGDGYLDEIKKGTQIIFKTPGVRYDVSAIQKAVKGGAKLSSEMELFFELCPAKIIAVTGSDGKTTTTSLIYDMLCRGGYTCYLGGNIGNPLIAELDKMKSDDIAVLELSSFQLHTMKTSADIAVVTNVTPNHLDWHTDFDEYVDAKRAVFKYQKGNGKAVFNHDNEITRVFAGEAKNPIFFGRVNPPRNGYCLDGDMIVYVKDGKKVREILNINDIYIPGMHNVENFMAAIAATDELVSDEVVRTTAREFKGVPHRIEFVRELNGVKYYNDSIASSPARTTAGLKSFNQKVIIIAGGYDKKIPFDEFGKVVNEHVKKLVLCGLTSDKIETAVKNADNYNDLPIYKCNDFKKAVETARDISESGDIVILSPACASFDLFKNFSERGNTFKKIVNEF